MVTFHIAHFVHHDNVRLINITFVHHVACCDLQQRRPSSRPQEAKSGTRARNARERLQNVNKRFLVTFKENSSVFFSWRTMAGFGVCTGRSILLLILDSLHRFKRVQAGTPFRFYGKVSCTRLRVKLIPLWGVGSWKLEMSTLLERRSWSTSQAWAQLGLCHKAMVLWLVLQVIRRKHLGQECTTSIHVLFTIPIDINI